MNQYYYYKVYIVVLIYISHIATVQDKKNNLLKNMM